MPRNMSVAYTEQQVRDRTKTVTRRAGWRFLNPGDHLNLVDKTMGLKPGMSPRLIERVQVVDVRREPLCLVARHGELALEGFPELNAVEFIHAFFEPQGISAGDEVTRVEWRYLDAYTPHGRLFGVPKGATHFDGKDYIRRHGRASWVRYNGADLVQPIREPKPIEWRLA